jgi:hypothetical protein
LNTKDQYEIEDQITKVWGVKDLLETFMWRYMDHPKLMTEDEVANHIFGISTLLDTQCEKLMHAYCKAFELNEYASDEVKAKRADVLKTLLDSPKGKKRK